MIHLQKCNGGSSDNGKPNDKISSNAEVLISIILARIEKPR